MNLEIQLYLIKADYVSVFCRAIWTLCTNYWCVFERWALSVQVVPMAALLNLAHLLKN